MASCRPGQGDKTEVQNENPNVLNCVTSPSDTNGNRPVSSNRPPPSTGMSGLTGFHSSVFESGSTEASTSSGVSTVKILSLREGKKPTEVLGEQRAINLSRKLQPKNAQKALPQAERMLSKGCWKRNRIRVIIVIVIAFVLLVIAGFVITLYKLYYEQHELNTISTTHFMEAVTEDLTSKKMILL
ncbi:hypothetical protein BIW11_00419 [Tropilaelaps mercedesae]|uniref:Uncharacterized protein n=1 Tax=Tropilaelaps mercedesae TaxID=418985 RepID=A0A1V9XVQ7_9ACAR|nr:hypothetical protein BIW11_00419 [Tropilaelaps mercedesae]